MQQKNDIEEKKEPLLLIPPTRYEESILPSLGSHKHGLNLPFPKPSNSDTSFVCMILTSSGIPARSGALSFIFEPLVPSWILNKYTI